MNPDVEQFIGEFAQAFENGVFVKLLLNRPGAAAAEGLRKTVVRPVEIKGVKKLSFVSTYPTKEIVKNRSLEESRVLLGELLGVAFMNAVLFATTGDTRLSYNRRKRSNIRHGKATYSTLSSTKHDREKERLIGSESSLYLKELRVTDASGAVAPGMRGKYRQINRYIETIDAALKASDLKDAKDIAVADMGSGKGYLTFALYDFLANTLKKEARVTGVEARKDMVDLCNGIAGTYGFDGLRFHEGNIAEYEPEKLDMLIALHACDTATDDALYQGIQADASIIIVSPCCYRQVRKAMTMMGALADIAGHGILLERQAEIVTDTLRGLVLEANGYKIKIFEFVSDEHTHKNIMIVGIKEAVDAKKKARSLEKIAALKELFGVNDFYLENLAYPKE